MAYLIQPKHVASNNTDKALAVIDALRLLSAKTVRYNSRSG